MILMRLQNVASGVLLLVFLAQVLGQTTEVPKVPDDASKERKFVSFPNRGIGLQMLESKYKVQVKNAEPAPDDADSSDEPPGESVALRALRSALEWTLDQRRPNWGWGSDTPHTVLALALADSTYFPSRSLESQLVMKQFELELVLRIWKHKEVPMTAGHLALNVMALMALCKDPRNFYSKDLVALLEHRETTVDFEVAFVTLASCSAGRHIRKARIRQLLDIMLDQSQLHSTDTLSVVILALHCSQRQRRNDLRNYLEESLGILLAQQMKDGSFASNLHTTAIALQALTASGLGATWNVTRAQEYIMSHQRPDGSFGNIFDTNAILPLLGGRTLLNVADMDCHEDQFIQSTDQRDGQVDIPHFEDTAPSTLKTATNNDTEGTPKAPEMITMTYIIWVGNDVTLRYNLTFTVPKNTTFFEIMKMAAEKDKNFEFSASKWANGYYVHTLSGQKEQQVGYWFWLMYRLREPPVPGIKPENKFVVALGVQELMPDDGDYILFWYHRI